MLSVDDHRNTMTSAKINGIDSMPPRLHVTGEDNSPDPLIIKYFKEEGFDVTYLPFGKGGKDYRDRLKHLQDDLELGESYAIVGTSLRLFTDGTFFNHISC